MRRLPGTLLQYGYNQVLEQLFQAHEQRLSKRGEAEWLDRGWVDRSQRKYSCPADRHLSVSFHLTPQVGTAAG